MKSKKHDREISLTPIVYPFPMLKSHQLPSCGIYKLANAVILSEHTGLPTLTVGPKIGFPGASVQGCSLSSGSSLTDYETVPAPPSHSLLSYFMAPYNIYQHVEYCIFTCLFFSKCVYFLLPLTFVSSIKGGFCLFTTEGSKICHPKICLLHFEIILSWLFQQTQKKLWKLSSYHFVRGVYI